MKIAICICTRRRTEQLKDLLTTLETMTIPSFVNLTVTIVENDLESISWEVISLFSKNSRLKIAYYLETKQGLVFARNRAVKEAGDFDFCCFVDDDQRVDNNFLDELVKCQTQFNADGVSSKCVPVFNKPVPSYINKFHTRNIYKYGHIIATAGTGGLMLKKSCLDQIAGPFDPRFNLSGCEDIYLTSQISRAGRVIRYTPDATIFEVIPDDRTTISYVIRRSYSDSNAEYFFRSLAKEKYFTIKSLTKLSIKFGYGVLLALPYMLFTTSEKLKGLLKVIHAVGGISFFLGKTNQFYRS